MNKKLHFLALSLLFILVGCGEKKSDPANSKAETAVTDSDPAKVPDAWIENRVAKAKEKLEASEAGKIVWKAMEAHGGLSQWFSNGPISFHFNYQPLGEGTPRNTYQVIDTWSSRARHFSAVDSTQQYGWTGEKAWEMVKDSTVFAYDTRFWSLTPFFFMGQPFVLEGDGTNLELLEQVDYNDYMYDVVKVTFEAGTGDAPDDYYVLYFNTKSHKLGVIRYIVSYPGYFEEGNHAPEKFMDLLGEQTASGIIFPENYKTYWLNEENGPGEHITDIELSDIEFLPKLKDSYFEIPESAKVSEENL
ncbi:MAG: hypothetical protein WA913_07920 [Pricia sp.]